MQIRIAIIEKKILVIIKQILRKVFSQYYYLIVYSQVAFICKYFNFVL